ncbi:glycosyltransferase family 4 protein [Rubrivirga sp.]|uniref:glycosyltransferase family 4 protein n=1 Tax=Rubrivirga sp. TaxID=1885344 RepID=UPI003B52A248
MRVLLLNDSAAPTAGAEFATLALRDGLRARGHEVRVLASDAELLPGPSFADRTCFGTTTRLQTLSSLANPSAVRALRRELAAFRPDVVHVTMFMWQLSPAILPLLRGVPAVYHAVVYKAVCPKGSKRLPDGTGCTFRPGLVCLREGCLTAAGAGPLLLQHALWRRGREAFDRVVAASEAVRARLEAEDVRVDAVIYPASVPPRVEAEPGGVPLVTFVGRLSPDKGADVLLRAFRRVLDRVPTARLRLIGAGEAEADLRALAAGLGLGEAVEWTGAVYGEALAEHVADAWVHVVPSVWAETFGLTTTEAMHRGTAVAATDIGGSAEIVADGETGRLVPPGDDRALADALVPILRDRALAARMGRAGRRRAERLFTADATVDRFAALYHDLLDRSPVHV